MTHARTLLAIGLMLSLLAACSTAERDAPADGDPGFNCARQPSDGDEKDGGVGGTGKTPKKCEDEPRSE